MFGREFLICTENLQDLFEWFFLTERLPIVYRDTLHRFILPYWNLFNFFCFLTTSADTRLASCKDRLLGYSLFWHYASCDLQIWSSRSYATLTKIPFWLDFLAHRSILEDVIGTPYFVWENAFPDCLFFFIYLNFSTSSFRSFSIRIAMFLYLLIFLRLCWITAIITFIYILQSTWLHCVRTIYVHPVYTSDIMP